MKQKHIIKAYAISLIGFTVACTSESVQLPDEPVSTVAVTDLSPQRACIEKYIEKNKPATRSGEYTVTPYVEEGDTLMYVVQYADGWELFSNSFTMPMSLMKNDTGTFAEAVAHMNPALKAMYGGILQLLRNDKEEESPEAMDGSSQWGAYSVQSSPGTGGGGNEPVYTLVGTKSYPRVAAYIPHLLKTNWDQESHYNYYMPYQQYNPSQHILVGCVAVATGQFLKYSHDTWGKPMLAPSDASYNSSSNSYSFSGFSTSPWAEMQNIEGTIISDLATPKFLGWIAKEINAYPVYENEINISTDAYLEAAAPFIANQTGYSTQCLPYDSDKVTSMILKQEPVILLLLSLNGSESRNHAVVIDEVDYTCDETDYYYAYVTPNSSTNPDPTMPPGPSISTDADYNQLVSQYGVVYTEKHKNCVSFFRFAWGYKNGICNEFRVNSKVIKDVDNADNDLVNNYCYYGMMTYTR